MASKQLEIDWQFSPKCVNWGQKWRETTALQFFLEFWVWKDVCWKDKVELQNHMRNCTIARSSFFHKHDGLITSREVFMVPLSLLSRLRPSFSKHCFSYSNLTKRMTSFGAPRVERDGTSGLITIHPAIGKHSATVVFCHGLGDSGEGFCDVAENMSRAMPYCKFILPTANVRPVTLNGGMKMNAWYDIVGLTDRASESCAGIDQSVATIRALLEGEHRLGRSSFERSP